MLNLAKRLGRHPLIEPNKKSAESEVPGPVAGPTRSGSWQLPSMQLRLPHVDFRLPQGPVRMPHLGMRLPQVDFKMPHLPLPHVSLPNVSLPHVSFPHVDLRHVDLRHLDLAQLAELERALAVPPARNEGRSRRWMRYAAGSLTVLALVFGFRSLDQTVSRWFAGSEPAGAWEGEAADWYQLYANAEPVTVADDLTAGAPEADAVASPAGVATIAVREDRTADKRRAKSEQRFVRVAVTAYTSAEAQTDDSPTITASNTRVSERTVAVSRDLLRTFTPGAPFNYGDKILIPGVGIYRIEDTMNGRWRRKIDLWFASKDEARRWGVRTAYIAKVEESAPTVAYRSP
ncbi:MAG: hypothetical protein U0527_08640 [Candidatus Eisenbacteria bacterium]